MHARHRDLHDVRGGSLDRHVDRHPLRRVADRVHPARHVRDVAAPAEQRLDVPLLDAERLRLEDVAAHLPVALEVLIDEALRLLARYLHPPGEAKVTHAVNDSEVEHLRDVPLLPRHRVLRNAESGGGGAPMDIGTGPERIQERRVLGHVGEHSQLDLRVVRGDEDPVRRPRGSFSSSNSSDCSCFGEFSPNSWPTAAKASCSIRATSRANSSPSDRRYPRSTAMPASSISTSTSTSGSSTSR